LAREGFSSTNNGKKEKNLKVSQ